MKIGFVLAICGLGFAPAPILGTGAAFAQSTYDGVKQAALTRAQIIQYRAAQKDLEAVLAEAAYDNKPDPNTVARLEAVAKKYHFASYEDYKVVAGNIALVMDGIDPKTRKYVGAEVMLKQQIAEVTADKKMDTVQKKEALVLLNAELKGVPPLQFPANVNLVLEHYDELYAAGQLFLR
jgi:hypothetical protein